MSSTTDKISGKAKQAVGQATKNHELQAKGKGEEVRGKVKDTSKKMVKDIENIQRA